MPDDWPQSVWASSPRMTVCVDVDARQRIVAAPPIVHKFIGQRLAQLKDWMAKQGCLVVERM